MVGTIWTLKFFRCEEFPSPSYWKPCNQHLIQTEKAVKENFEDMMKEAARRLSALKYETEKSIDIC